VQELSIATALIMDFENLLGMDYLKYCYLLLGPTVELLEWNTVDLVQCKYCDAHKPRTYTDKQWKANNPKCWSCHLAGK
jgi:hypothetical protein